MQKDIFYHGTRVAYHVGDTIPPEHKPADNTPGAGPRFTRNLDEAVWDAELANGDNPPRVYIVQPTGLVVDRAMQPSHEPPGHPTMTLRTSGELRILGEVTEWPLYHGTRANLKTGDLIETGKTSNFGKTPRKSNFVYMSRTLDAAVWGAELAAGEGKGRIYIVEPTGPIEDDPNLTDQKFPGNPTKSFRSRKPLRVIGEVHRWQGHPEEAVRAMKQGIHKLENLGIEPEDD